MFLACVFFQYRNKDLNFLFGGKFFKIEHYLLSKSLFGIWIGGLFSFEALVLFFLLLRAYSNFLRRQDSHKTENIFLECLMSHLYLLSFSSHFPKMFIWNWWYSNTFVFYAPFHLFFNPSQKKILILLYQIIFLKF